MNDQMIFFIPNRPVLDKPYELKGVGLPNVFLLNGVTIEDDDEAGELITIENLKGLHRAIALHIIAKQEAMSGHEFRFLRKLMRLTQAQLAVRMSLSSQTIANYEKGNTAPPQASAHVRLLSLIDMLPEDASDDLVREVLRIARDTGLKLADFRKAKIAEGWRERPRFAA